MWLILQLSIKYQLRISHISYNDVGMHFNYARLE